MTGQVILCNGATPIPDVTLRAGSPPAGQPCCCLRGAAGWRAASESPSSTSVSGGGQLPYGMDAIIRISSNSPLSPARDTLRKDALLNGRAASACRESQEERSKQLEARNPWGVDASSWRPPTLPEDEHRMWSALSLRDALAGAGLEPISTGEVAQDGQSAAAPDVAGPSMALRAALAFGDFRRKFQGSAFGRALAGGDTDERVMLGSGDRRVGVAVDAGLRWGAELQDAFARVSSSTSDIVLGSQGTPRDGNGSGPAVLGPRARAGAATDRDGETEAMPPIGGGGDGIVDSDRVRGITAAFICSSIAGSVAFSSRTSPGIRSGAPIVDKDAWIKAEAKVRPAVASMLVGGPLSQSVLLGMGAQTGTVTGVAASQAVEEFAAAMHAVLGREDASALEPEILCNIGSLGTEQAHT